MSYSRKGKGLQITVEDESKRKLLEKAGKELFSFILDLRRVHKMKTLKIELSAQTFEQLCLDWINELLSIVEVNSIALRYFDVELKKSEEEYRLFAKVQGQEINEHHKLQHKPTLVHPNIDYNGKKLKFRLE